MGIYDFVEAPDDLGEVQATTPQRPAPGPPTAETVLERVMNELNDLPKAEQQKLYRFLYDCGCRI